MSEESQLKPFPAKIDFVVLSSAVFNAARLPASLAEGTERDPAPQSWKLDMAYRPAGGGKYLVKAGIKAAFEGGESGTASYELSLELTSGIVVSENVTVEFTKEWLEKGVRYLLLPYIRAAVATLMQGTGFATPHVPLVAIPVPMPPDRDPGEGQAQITGPPMVKQD